MNFAQATTRFVLAVAVAGAALVAAPVAAQTEPTLDRIKQAGKVVFGYRSDARPLSFADAAGKPAGYSVGLCEKIAEQLKVDVGNAAIAIQWVPVTLEGRFADVASGKIDLLCGADTPTVSRRKEVSFSLPVFPGGIGALLRADASNDLKDVLSGRVPSRPTWRGSPSSVLEKRIFAVVPNTTTDKWLQGRIDAFRITALVQPVGDYATGVKNVANRSADVFFGDRAVLLDAARASGLADKVTVLDRWFTQEAIALALRRGDEEFRFAVDRALSKIFAGPDFRATYVKWFGEPDERAITFYRLNALPE